MKLFSLFIHQNDYIIYTLNRATMSPDYSNDGKLYLNRIYDSWVQSIHITAFLSHSRCPVSYAFDKVICFWCVSLELVRVVCMWFFRACVPFQCPRCEIMGWLWRAQPSVISLAEGELTTEASILPALPDIHMPYVCIAFAVNTVLPAEHIDHVAAQMSVCGGQPPISVYASGALRVLYSLISSKTWKQP